MSHRLSILGVFAEPLMDTRHFVHLIGKEQLMGSDLLTYLMEEKTAQLEAQFEAKSRQKLQQSLQAILAARFPQAPIALVQNIQRVNRTETLHELLVAAAQAATIEEFEPHLRQAVRESQQPAAQD